MRFVLFFILAIAGISTTAYADTWKIVYVKDGIPYVLTATSPGAHVLEDGEYPANYSFPNADAKYWKKQGNDWVEMNQSQKDKVDSDAKDAASDISKWDSGMEALVKVIAELHKLTESELKELIKAKIDKDKAHKEIKDKGSN